MVAHCMQASPRSLHSLSPLDAPKIAALDVRGIAYTRKTSRHQALRLPHGKACAVLDTISEVSARPSGQSEDSHEIESATKGYRKSQEGQILSRRHLAIGASGLLATAGTGAAADYLRAH